MTTLRVRGEIAPHTPTVIEAGRPTSFFTSG